MNQKVATDRESLERELVEKLGFVIYPNGVWQTATHCAIPPVVREALLSAERQRRELRRLLLKHSTKLVLCGKDGKSSWWCCECNFDEGHGHGAVSPQLTAHAAGCKVARALAEAEALLEGTK